MKRLGIAFVFVLGLWSIPTEASEGKVYSVYVAENGQMSYVLSNLETVKFHGVACLKGTYASKEWIEDKTIYLPVNKIVAVVEFDSFEEYRNAFKKFYEKGRIE